ncbi:MAG: CinA family protein [Acholeplasmataceae bacterium]|nr:CinA family protein [Acholeplasmataceae bacterium]
MIAKKVFTKCLNKGLTMAFAESMTGGALTYEIVKNPGASKVTPGGIITYSTQQKIKSLHLDPSLFEQYDVVSKEVAEKMASAIKQIMKTDIGISVTGNAGPEKQTNTDSLDAWIAINFKGNIWSYHLEFHELTRVQSIKKTVKFIYEKLDECF